MKRIFFVIIGLSLAFFIFSPKTPAFGPSTESAQQKSTGAVSVTIDTGASTVTTSAIGIKTAYDGLQEGAKAEQLPLKTKQYDFGIFVEGVGTLMNTQEKAWIFFVNGKAGTQAADKQSVKPGDYIEWKYMKPAFE